MDQEIIQDTKIGIFLETQENNIFINKTMSYRLPCMSDINLVQCQLLL